MTIHSNIAALSEHLGTIFGTLRDTLQADAAAATAAANAASTAATNAQTAADNAAQAAADAVLTDAEVKSQYEANGNTNAFTDTDKTKLGRITISSNINLNNIGDLDRDFVAEYISTRGTI